MKLKVVLIAGESGVGSSYLAETIIGHVETTTPDTKIKYTSFLEPIHEMGRLVETDWDKLYLRKDDYVPSLGMTPREYLFRNMLSLVREKGVRYLVDKFIERVVMLRPDILVVDEVRTSEQLAELHTEVMSYVDIDLTTVMLMTKEMSLSSNRDIYRTKVPCILIINNFDGVSVDTCEEIVKRR